MKPIFVYLLSIGSFLFPRTHGDAIKKGEIGMRDIIRIILALVLFVIFAAIVVKAQSGAKEGVCGGIAEQFKARIYDVLKISVTKSPC